MHEQDIYYWLTHRHEYLLATVGSRLLYRGSLKSKINDNSLLMLSYWLQLYSRLEKSRSIAIKNGWTRCYMLYRSLGRASSKDAHGSQSDDRTYPCAVVFTSPLTSRFCSQLQELQELPTSPLRMWSSSKEHQLLLTWDPGLGDEPGSKGHEADALPLSYLHIPGWTRYMTFCFLVAGGFLVILIQRFCCFNPSRIISNTIFLSLEDVWWWFFYQFSGLNFSAVQKLQDDDLVKSR